jgi:pyruvate,water dikinase
MHFIEKIMKTEFLIELDSKTDSENIGNKAKNLFILKKIKKIHIPKTWVIPWETHDFFKESPESTIKNLNSSIQNQINPDCKYAVRSSSNIEDEKHYSYAGLFKTFLNVMGYSEIITSIRMIWESIESESIQEYLGRLSLTHNDIRMAVILQEMVDPVYSGVCFTRNPMTGTHEIIIEAVAGEGTALVQNGITPERWIAHSDGWLDKPENSKMPTEVIDHIFKDIKRIFMKVKVPIDLEWVYDGHDLYWVQMREITTLEDLTIYSNRISRDVMPGIIHPLIWSINVPLINTQWLLILEDMVGKISVKPKDLAKSFYFRSYFNISTFGDVFKRLGLPQESLEMMQGIVPNKRGKMQFKPTLKMMRYLPRFVGFLFNKLRFEKEVEKILQKIQKGLDKFTHIPEEGSRLEDLVDEIDELFDVVQEIVYFNISLPLLTTAYVRLLEKQLFRTGVDFKQFDLYENMQELDNYNPNVALSELKHLYDNLGEDSKKQLSIGTLQSDSNHQEFSFFQSKFEQFIDKFGHLSDNSNNFTAKPWRENPAFVMEMIKDFETNPHDMQARLKYSDLDLRGLKKRLIKFLYSRSRRFTLYRDKVSYHYIYGYGLFRPYFLEIAARMVENGWLEYREDIFYLEWSEIKNAILKDMRIDFKEVVDVRKSDMKNYEKIKLPDVIFGEDPPPVFIESYGRMHGTPTSQGYYDGEIKVISGREDFGKVEQGDVIVIPYSDVGWTPLFSRAGAVIAESGGILSHSSIIAREYQIPAVVSVSNCMQLKDFQRVSVNGFTGDIVLLDDQDK